MNEEFIMEFVEEAAGHVEACETGLLALEKGSDDPEVVNSIFRAVHSIKGTAGFFGLNKIVELSHIMENLLGQVRSDQLTINSPMIDDLLQSNDCLKEMIKNVAQSDQSDIETYLMRLNQYVTGSPAASSHEAMPGPPSDLAHVLNLSEDQLSLIQDAVRHGHNTYKIKMNQISDFTDRKLDPGVWVQTIGSIGNLIALQPPLDEWPSGAQTVMTYFTSVMDPSLVSIALDLPEDRIGEWVIDTPPAELNSELEPHPSQDTRTIVHPGEEPFKKSAVVQAEETIRVTVPLLNNLLDLTSEMVLGRNQLLRILESQKKMIPGLDAVLQNIDHLTTELQDKVMHTRMQPVANVFNKFPRLVRELSRKMEKEIELEMDGTEVELDKSIIEALADPMTHLIRNALDHGIEKPAEREAFGKFRIGRISINAYHEAGHVNIDIADDGAGINAEKVARSAIKKGLVTEAEVAQMRESELLNLIFLPGFSTAEQITDVSGRGVGMDVVKTNIEKLGGTIETYTAPGRGTTFRLVMPLTLAIIPSLIVEVRGQKFALPQINLQEMVRIKPGDSSRQVEYVHDAPVLRLRGKLLPLVRLDQVLGYPDLPPDRPEAGTEPITRILVLKMGLRKYGLVVDGIDDGEEILVKPLSRFLKSCPCYSGVTILGDGRTALILDPDGIAFKANLHYVDEQLQSLQAEQRADHETTSETQNLLLFQGAGPETFALDMPMILRVEQIQREQIEFVGNREYLPFRGQALRLIRPEDYLPVQRGKPDTDRMFVIIPKLVAHPIGILVHVIHDTVMTSLALNPEDMKTKGLIGSCMLADQMVLLINIYELLELAAPEWYGVGKAVRPGAPRTVLIVEDTPFFARMEKNYLEWAGFSVLSAGNGSEAMGILEKQAVDLVVSDIQMPVMDGYELLKSMKADPRLARIPVIAVTSMSGDANRRRGLDAGFDYYENKLDKASLLEKVEFALAGKRDAS